MNQRMLLCLLSASAFSTFTFIVFSFENRRFRKRVFLETREKRWCLVLLFITVFNWDLLGMVLVSFCFSSRDALVRLVHVGTLKRDLGQAVGRRGKPCHSPQAKEREREKERVRGWG